MGAAGDSFHFCSHLGTISGYHHRQVLQTYTESTCETHYRIGHLVSRVERNELYPQTYYLQLKRYQQIFFDLDGTLWDIQTNSKLALREIFFELFPEQHEMQFDNFYKSYQKWNERLWTAYRKNQITKEQLRTSRFEKALSSAKLPFNSHVIENMAGSFLERCPALPNLMPGAKELLDHCAHRYKIHIITNGFKEVQEIKMQSSGILHYFEHFFYSEDVGVKKPHPEIFHKALEKCQCSTKDVLMIGDDWGADIIGARNVGIDQVYYNPKTIADRRHNYIPTYHIHHLLKLKEIL